MFGLYKVILVNTSGQGHGQSQVSCQGIRAGLVYLEKFLSRHIMESVQDDIALVTLASLTSHACGALQAWPLYPLSESRVSALSFGTQALSNFPWPWTSTSLTFYELVVSVPLPGPGRRGWVCGTAAKECRKSHCCLRWTWDSGRWAQGNQLDGDLVSNQPPLLPPRDRCWEAQHR